MTKEVLDRRFAPRCRVLRVAPAEICRANGKKSRGPASKKGKAIAQEGYEFSKFIDTACISMAYSKKALNVRRCLHLKPKGERCKSFAMWGNLEQFCSEHCGRTRGRSLTYIERIDKVLSGQRPKAPRCECSAYKWPHRPGGGLCRWPDDPLGQCPTPAGTCRDD